MSKKDLVLELFGRIGTAKNRDERKKIKHGIVELCKPVIDTLCRMYIKYQQPSDGLEIYGTLLALSEREGVPSPSLKHPVLDEEFGEITFVFNYGGKDEVVALELDMLKDGEVEDRENMLMECRIGVLEDMVEDGMDEFQEELNDLKEKQKLRQRNG